MLPEVNTHKTVSLREGYDSFQVMSEDKIDPDVQARGVIQFVDYQAIYFMSNESYYCMTTGETVYEAIVKRGPLPNVEKHEWWILKSQIQPHEPFMDTRQQYVRYILSPMTAGNLGLLAAPGSGPLLTTTALFPGRPGLWMIGEPVETVATNGDSDKNGK